MLADGGQWWIRRFQHMANYFDAYRIDHVLGFFRIWSIPGECVHALMGQFDPSIAMTRDEIESYGLTFDEERYTTPCINDWILERIFGTQADEVKQAFLETRPDGLYAMRPEYATERMIEAAFAHRRTKADTTLRDNLYKLTSNVLSCATPTTPTSSTLASPHSSTSPSRHSARRTGHASTASTTTTIIAATTTSGTAKQ